MSDKKLFLNERDPMTMLFYTPKVVGGKEHKDEIVFVVHGWIGSANVTKVMGVGLQQDFGWSVFRMDLSTVFTSWEGLMGEAGEQLEKVNFGRDYKKVHFIGHSLGGLIVFDILSRWRFKNPGKVVSLGTPFKGSPLFQRIEDIRPTLSKTFIIKYMDEILKAVMSDKPKSKFKIGLVAGSQPYSNVSELLTRSQKELDFRIKGLKGPNDGSVTVRSAHGLPTAHGVVDTATLEMTHNQLISHPRSRTVVDRFLRTGKFGNVR